MLRRHAMDVKRFAFLLASLALVTVGLLASPAVAHASAPIATTATLTGPSVTPAVILTETSLIAPARVAQGEPIVGSVEVVDANVPAVIAPLQGQVTVTATANGRVVGSCSGTLNSYGHLAMALAKCAIPATTPGVVTLVARYDGFSEGAPTTTSTGALEIASSVSAPVAVDVVPAPAPVVVPTAHTGKPWSGWLWWALVGLMGVFGLISLGLGWHAALVRR